MPPVGDIQLLSIWGQTNRAGGIWDRFRQCAKRLSRRQYAILYVQGRHFIAQLMADIALCFV